MLVILVLLVFVFLVLLVLLVVFLVFLNFLFLVLLFLLSLLADCWQSRVHDGRVGSGAVHLCRIGSELNVVFRGPHCCQHIVYSLFTSRAAVHVLHDAPTAALSAFLFTIPRALALSHPLE